MSEFKEKIRGACSNLMNGYIRVDLDQDSDLGNILYAHINSDSAGVDDVAKVELMTRKQEDADGCDQIWIVDVAMLRRICDMAEAMHEAASMNFKRTGA